MKSQNCASSRVRGVEWPKQSCLMEDQAHIPACRVRDVPERPGKNSGDSWPWDWAWSSTECSGGKAAQSQHGSSAALGSRRPGYSWDAALLNLLVPCPLQIFILTKQKPSPSHFCTGSGGAKPQSKLMPELSSIPTFPVFSKTLSETFCQVKY